MEQDIQVYEAPGEVSLELQMTRPPEVVLAEAQRAAAALCNVIAAKPKRVIFGGEQYLGFEDWALVARFYGCTTRIVETKPADFGDIRGFEATAVCLQAATGQEISRATAYCLTDEDRWRSKPVYSWKDGPRGRVREKVGDEPVPLFQLASMAQTRASAKVLRGVFGPIVVLAGYRPTPAEEMQGVPGFDDHPQTPQRKGKPEELITEKQAKRLWAVFKNSGQSEGFLVGVLAHYGYTWADGLHLSQIKKGDYEQIVAELEKPEGAE